MCVEREMKLTPTELANEICMGSGKAIVVEGPADKKFWTDLQSLYAKHYSIYTADTCGTDDHSNRTYVVDVLQVLEER